MDRKWNVTRKCSYIMASALLIVMTTGCGMRDAVTGGFFGAVGEIVSTLMLNVVFPAS